MDRKKTVVDVWGCSLIIHGITLSIMATFYMLRFTEGGRMKEFEKSSGRALCGHLYMPYFQAISAYSALSHVCEVQHNNSRDSLVLYIHMLLRHCKKEKAFLISVGEKSDDKPCMSWGIRNVFLDTPERTPHPEKFIPILKRFEFTSLLFRGFAFRVITLYLDISW